MPDSAVQDPKITRELPVPPVAGQPLDPSLLRLNEVERGFLLKTVSPDEAEMERRIRDTQELYVSTTHVEHIVDDLLDATGCSESLSKEPPASV
jgi:hypothetical protein